MAPEHSVSINPTDPEFVADPYRFYQELHSQTPFFWEHYQLWCVTDYATVNQLLRDRRCGRRAPADADNEQSPSGQKPPEKNPTEKAHMDDFHAVEEFSLLNQEPPAHTRLRKLAGSAFLSRQIESMQHSIEKDAHSLIDQIEGPLKAGKTVDLLTSYATPMPARIIADLIGVPHQYIPELLAWSHCMVKVYTMTQTHDDEVAANQAASEFQQLILQLLQQRRLQPTDDLLSKLAQAHIAGAAHDQRALTDAEIVSTVILLLNAGHEATVHQLGNAVKTILNSPFKPEELFANPAQCKRTVQELMRIDTPLHLFTRYALEDITLESPSGVPQNSVTISAGEQVGLLLGAANHDPRRFERPAEFNPDRDDAGHVSLGAGIHYCLGAALAQMELITALSVLFKRLPELKLAETPVYRNSYHFRGLDKVMVTLQ